MERRYSVERGGKRLLNEGKRNPKKVERELQCRGR